MWPHHASPVLVVSSLVETQRHTINNPPAEHFASHEASLSPRVYPVVLSPDGSHRRRDQAAWPAVPSIEGARGIGAAMALPTGTATARSHELEFACDASLYPVGRVTRAKILCLGGAPS